MNKANVFLLVVVSSLLTYISTATQPAAIAGVAPEKWEYGVSTMAKLGPTGYTLHFSSNKQYGSCSGILIKGDVVFNIRNLDSSKGVTETYQGEPLNGRKGSAFFKMFWDSIGQQGWHPYQVLPSEDLNEYNRFQLPWEETTYWRRRVQ